MQETMIRDLTTGSVPKLLVRFSVPFILANALQFLYNVVDMIIVGQFVGPSGLSAVSIGGEFMHLFMLIALGLAQAGTVVIAQHVGAGQYDRLSRVIGNIFTLVLGVSVIVTVVSIVFTRQFAELLNTPPEAFSETINYCTVCGSGMFFVYGYNVVSNILRGLGDSKRPLYFISIAAVMNLILDLLFVAVLHMQAMGAALATVMGQAFSFFVSIVYLYRKREAFGFDFKLRSFRPEGKLMLTLLKLGIPICLQFTAISISMMYVTACINVYGVVYSAVTGISSKISQLCNIVTTSMNAAGSTMIGQNFGAGEKRRVSAVVWYVLLISVGFAVFLSALLLLFPQATFRMFNQDPEVLLVGMEIIPVILLNFFGAASRAPASALINGIGFAGMNFVMGLMDGIVVRIGLAVLFGRVLAMGVHGYWYGSAIAGFMFFVVIFPYFLSGAWKKRSTVLQARR